MTGAIVYLAIVLCNDARAERALSFGLGTGCMAAAVLLRKRQLRFHIELNKGGKRTFTTFQAKTQYFRSRF